MIKKMFKFSIILGFIVLLSGCGKKVTVEDVFMNSIVNFNNCSNYDSNLNVDMSINNNDSTLISISYSGKEQVDKTSKVGVIENSTNFSFLGFGDTQNEQGYIDYTNNKKYSKTQNDETFIISDFKSSEDLSYGISNFLQNGVIISGEMTEYTNQEVVYYAIPCQITFNTFKAFLEGLNLDAEQKNSLQESLNNLTEEDLTKLSTVSIGVRYYVYKDSLLPARIMIDKDSLKTFLTVCSEVLNNSKETSEENSSDITFNLDIDLNGISFNINTIEAIFTNYNLQESLVIPDEVISTAIEGETTEGITLGEGFSMNFGEESFVEENISEIPEMPEEENENINIEDISSTEQFEIKEENSLIEIFKNLGFYIEDEFFDFSFTCQDFINKGFDIHEDLKEEILEPGNYSIPINHISDNGYFTVTYMNNTEEPISLLNCTVLSIELDSIFFEDITSVTSWKIPYNASLDVLIEDLGSPSYKYSGDLTYVYTYELDNTHYIEFQIDKETNNVCYVKLFSMDV